MTINLSRGEDIERNEATETWELTLLGSTNTILTANELPFPALADSKLPVTTGQSTVAGQGLVDANQTLTAATTTADGVYFVKTDTSLGGEINIFLNSGDTSVYRWNAEEHTTISPVVGTTNFFSALPGSQGVLIK